MNRTTTRRLVVIATLSGVAVLGACGSDDDSSTDTVPDTVAVAPTTAAVEGSVAAPTPPPASAPATEESSGASAPAAPTGPVLTIADFAFSELAAEAGTEFSIINNDGFSHTVTDRDGAFDVPVAAGATVPLTIERAGTYEIFCRIHPSMTATITVA